ncbi:SRPBCC family protein [Rhodococcus sp. IEGM 1330]|uniref:SRPBCC family protein n=1 Tax=Rhodococcus sp. IEGM 1330 TaxID=3082225 RepID=UPI002955AC00|nr:SRPBCC family protein [Rhodococcus sp. IEGM 1330]MDV8021070.1 SRPBCC family protein [Rhodococcus sp. IEGM 1330]
MREINRSAVASTSRDAAFAYMDDFRNVPQWMFGISRFEPTSDILSGLGATYDATMQIGPKALTSVVHVTEWVHNERLTLESVEGLSNSSTWSFSDTADGGTRLDVVFRYSLPGGIAGKVLGAVVEPVVGQAIKHTESTLRARLEATD